MIFSHPDGGTFEIPDSWWVAAKMQTFARQGDHYNSAVDEDHPNCSVRLISISQITPMRRNQNVPLDFGGFGRERMVSVLLGIAANAAIKPVKIRPSITTTGYIYDLYDGMHRYHASIAAGYSLLPAIVDNWGVY
jgi:hypothetical protein